MKRFARLQQTVRQPSNDPSSELARPVHARFPDSEKSQGKAPVLRGHMSHVAICCSFCAVW